MKREEPNHFSNKTVRDPFQKWFQPSPNKNMISDI